MWKNFVKLIGLDFSDILLVAGSWYLPCLWLINIVTFCLDQTSQPSGHALYLECLGFKSTKGYKLLQYMVLVNILNSLSTRISGGCFKLYALPSKLIFH